MELGRHLDGGADGNHATGVLIICLLSTSSGLHIYPTASSAEGPGFTCGTRGGSRTLKTLGLNQLALPFAYTGLRFFFFFSPHTGACFLQFVSGSESCALLHWE